MKQNSFAPIITAENNFPTATQLPFVVCEHENALTLKSHFAKANPHWKEIDNKECLVIFSGADAYISPIHYENKLNVPTWNYVSVHAYGQVNLITDETKAMDLLRTTIAFFDKAWLQQWEQLPDEYRFKMLKGIVPFEITVTDLQGKKKLSQNKLASEQQKIKEVMEENNLKIRKISAGTVENNSFADRGKNYF